MHHYFGTLEQYQDIPRVTLSVNGEQCMCRRVARRTPRYCSNNRVIIQKAPTVCDRLYTVCFFV